MSYPDIPPYPHAGSALAYGWHAMKDHFLLLLLVVIVLIVVDIPLDQSERMGEETFFGGLLLLAYWLLFLPVINYSADAMFLRSVRGERVAMREIVEGFNSYVNVVLAALLVLGLVGISFMLFIIPGIYVGCRLAFVSYLVMDEGLDPIEAVEASWRLTRNNTWHVFALGLMSSLIGLLGLLLLVVGIVPAIMWAKAAFAALYLSIVQHSPEFEIVDEPEFHDESELDDES